MRERERKREIQRDPLIINLHQEPVCHYEVTPQGIPYQCTLP